LLNYFRSKRTPVIGIYLAIFTLFVKMVMPIAHASTAISGDSTSFFASICTANGIVKVDVNEDLGGTNHVTTNTNCPLCFIVDNQHFIDDSSSNTLTLSFFENHTLFYSLFSVTDTRTLRSDIRGPPTFS